MELMQATRQWASRPEDERYVSLPEMAAALQFERQCSNRRVLPNRDLTVIPSTTDEHDIAITGPNGHPAQFTHWGFGQTCALAGVPAKYIRDSKMPGALAADCLNWGLHHVRPVEEVSCLLKRYPAGYTHREPGVFMGAMNGPDYGVVWNSEIADQLVRNFGDGRTGQWRVPGEFGHAVDITKDNTTLYASDRDIWAFLADEERRIEVPNRRNGQSGSLARGFWVSNSEVGASTLCAGFFLFDYVCCNRIIWGAEQFREIRIRHTSGAPHRWVEEVKPILREFAESSPKGIDDTLAAARAQKIKGDVATFLASRFGSKSVVPKIELAFAADEGLRPMETIWDAVTGATAYARSLPNQDERVKVERDAGKLLAAVAA